MNNFLILKASVPPLTAHQKQILYQQATEAPFSGRFLKQAQSGDYLCAGCQNVLFKSDAKFDSHSGWPSFYQPVAKEALLLRTDNSVGVRTEVVCRNCQGHLGHVFNDAPQTPTGLRYCINSGALQFKDSSGQIING